MEKVAIVTGGTDGVGRSLVRALFNDGYEVHCIGSNASKGEALASELSSGAGSFQFWQLDLSNLDEVKRFASKFSKQVSEISRLVFSAGVVLPRRAETEQGLEKTFAINYLSAYYLSRQFKPLLVRGARVLFVSGGGGIVLKPRLDFDNLQLTQGYNAGKAAANAVHAKTVLAQILAQDWADDGICVNTFHPGIVRSSLGRNFPFPLNKLAGVAGLAMSADSKTGINAALSPSYEGLSGYFFEGKKQKQLAFKNDYCEQLRVASERLLEQSAL